MSIESRSNQYGHVFGQWKIRKRLDSGSSGKTAVFQLARRASDWEEYSALKVISLIEERGSYADYASYRQMEYLEALQAQKDAAITEVQLMAQLQGSTNIVDYLDYQFENWSDASGFGCDLLIRMELLTDLRSVIKKGKLFEEAEILKLGKDICSALMLCHENNILHRDIKPENIFLNKRGDYKLGDFGISRLLSAAPMAMATTGIGTPEYAAPEQFTGKHDKRVDIYSLGLVLYELSNQNRLPFASSSYARQEDIMKRQSGIPLPTPASASAMLWEVIHKACAFDPADRYQTAQEFLDALCRLDYALIADRYQTAPSGRASSGYETAPAGRASGGYETAPAGRASGGYETAPAGKASGGYETAPAGRASGGYETAPAARASGGNDTAPAGHTPVPRQKPGKGSPIKWPVFTGIAATLLLALLLFIPKAEDNDFQETEPSKPEQTQAIRETVHVHSWEAATCITPQTCRTCGETEGSELGHTWIDATPTAPKTCTRCGVTEGTALQVFPVIPSISSLRSSSLYTGDLISHPVSNLLDGNPSTNWTEGVSGCGEGEYVSFQFSQEYYLRGITIYAGNHFNREYYRKNARPKDISIQLSDGTVISYSLMDEMTAQYIPFDTYLKTSSVTIIIDSVYQGDKYTDTVISEVIFDAFY